MTRRRVCNIIMAAAFVLVMFSLVMMARERSQAQPLPTPQVEIVNF